MAPIARRFTVMMQNKIQENHSREGRLRAFKLFDTENTGQITFENLKRVATELGVGMSDEELMVMIEQVRACVGACLPACLPAVRGGWVRP